MKKTFLLFTLSLLLVGIAWGQGSESFTNSTATATYLDGNFIGDSGFTWTFGHSRNEGDYPITGNGLMLRRASDSYLTAVIPGGVGSFSFQYRKAFTGTSVRQLELIVNGTQVATSPEFGTTEPDLTVYTMTVDNINLGGSVEVKIKNVGTTTTNRQTVIDDLSWTGYTGGTPIVSTPVIAPGTGNYYEAFDATITCATTGATIYYTTDGTDPTDASTEYLGPINIAATTTLKAIAYAVDHDPSLIAEAVYTFLDPATTTIPYYEMFDADLGDCYVYSVSGTTKQWIWASYSGNGYAYMNGYNSGDLEDDWLILPGIDFTAYGDLQMTFDTWYNYGADDIDNYLKLWYSTDYQGYGDPTLATWIEIPFTVAATMQAWASSGILDLAGITGTSVWLGFQYHYNAGSYRSWEVDNISIEVAPEDPVIYVDPAILSGFTYVLGNGPSAEQSFTVSGVNLVDDIYLTAPTDYEISETSGSGFTDAITLYSLDNSVETTTIYVRLKAGLAIGTYNDELITVATTGAVSQTVACSGEVTTPPLPEAPVALAATDITFDGFTANWEPVAGATGYYLDVYMLEAAPATDLFFSEYIEGGSNNKAIEIYNGTGADVDLSDYIAYLYSNGSPTSTSSLALTGILANGDVYVVANSASVADILAVTDITSGVANFNGDDALSLYKVSTDSFVDIFGVIDQDPGAAWTADGGYSTVNKTLVRKATVTGGVTINPTNNGDGVTTDFVTLGTEWDVYPQDTFTYLGWHTTGSLSYVAGYQNLNVGNVTSYLVTGLAPNTMYYYVVRAYNDYGTSGNSNEITVTTEDEGQVPVELSSFAATLTAQSYVRLTWTTQTESQLVGYRVYRNISNDQSTSSMIDHPLIPATNTSTIQTYSAIDDDVEIGKTYYYWLEAVDYNNSDFHGPVSITVQGNVPPVLPTVTSMKNAYPNPFRAPGNTNIEVALKAGENGIITIYNISGQVVKTISVGEGEHVIPWNGQDSNGKTCGSGIYFYKLRTPSYSQTYKMVIMK